MRHSVNGPRHSAANAMRNQGDDEGHRVAEMPDAVRTPAMPATCSASSRSAPYGDRQLLKPDHRKDARNCAARGGEAVQSAEARHFAGPSRRETARSKPRQYGIVQDEGIPDSGHRARSEGVSPRSDQLVGHRSVPLRLTSRWTARSLGAPRSKSALLRAIGGARSHPEVAGLDPDPRYNLKIQVGGPFRSLPGAPLASLVADVSRTSAARPTSGAYFLLLSSGFEADLSADDPEVARYTREAGRGQPASERRTGRSRAHGRSLSSLVGSFGLTGTVDLFEQPVPQDAVDPDAQLDLRGEHLRVGRRLHAAP